MDSSVTNVQNTPKFALSIIFTLAIPVIVTVGTVFSRGLIGMINSLFCAYFLFTTLKPVKTIKVSVITQSLYISFQLLIIVLSLLVEILFLFNIQAPEEEKKVIGIFDRVNSVSDGFIIFGIPVIASIATGLNLYLHIDKV